MKVNSKVYIFSDKEYINYSKIQGYQHMYILFPLALLLGGIIELLSLSKPESWPKIGKNIVFSTLGSALLLMLSLLIKRPLLLETPILLLSWAIMALIFLAMFSLKYVLPKIDETKVALLHILLILSFLSYNLNFFAYLPPPVLILFVIITAIIFTNVFLTEKPVPYFRLGLYIWYLFLVCLITLMRAGGILPLLTAATIEVSDLLTFVNYIIDGGIFMYFMLHFMAIIMLIPGKQSSIAETKRHVGMLINKFSIRQANVKKFLLLSGAMIAAFIVNQFVSLIPQLTLTGLLFLLIPIVPEDKF